MIDSTRISSANRPNDSESSEFRCYSFNSLVRHGVAQEMRVGPSEPVYKDRLQTTLSCFPQRREVVSVKEKVPQDGIR